MTNDTPLARRDAITAVAAFAATGLASAAQASSTSEQDHAAVAESHHKARDAGEVDPTNGIGLFDHFADDADICFPKWGIARGKAEVSQMFSDVGRALKSSKHNCKGFNCSMNGTDVSALEGTSERQHRDGIWMADQSRWCADLWCDCFKVKDRKTSRPFICLDPDCAGQNTVRYDWISA